MAGGTGKYGDSRGIPSDVYTNIVADPTEPGRVYISTRSQGLYAIPDIAYLYYARLNNLDLDYFPRLPDSPSANEYEGSMVLDPNDNKVLYVANGNTLYKGTRDNNSSERLQEQRWTWTPLVSSDSLLTFDAWSQKGQDCCSCSNAKRRQMAATVLRECGQQLATFAERRRTLLSTRNPLFDFSEASPIIFAVTGRDDKVYLSVQNPKSHESWTWHVRGNASQQPFL